MQTHKSLPTAIDIPVARWLGYLAYLLLLAIVFVIFVDDVPHPGFLTSFALSFLLGAIIPTCILVRTKIDLLEPIYWFAAMYYLIVPGVVYYILTDYSYSQHLLDYSQIELFSLTERALILFIVGYISFLLGYLVTVGRPTTSPVTLPTNSDMSGWVARVVIAICLILGFLNFLYLLARYPGGPMRYLMEFGLRSGRFVEIEGYVTTIGYNFAYAGIYIWLLILKRARIRQNNYFESLLFVTALLTTFVMSISQGRLSQTVMYLLTLVALSYGLEARPRNKGRVIVMSTITILFGPILYFFRRVSVATADNVELPNVSELISHANTFVQAIGYWLIDKGNIPNFAAVVNLIAQDGINGRYWYGKSAVTWLTQISSTFGNIPNVGQTLGSQWFAMDGGIPPTIVGEAFVNFGYLGVPIGLLIAGIVCALAYRTLRVKGTFIYSFVFIILLVRFFFFWPKGETSNIVGAVWQIIPGILAYYMIRIVSAIRT